MNPTTRKNIYYGIAGLLLGTAIIVPVYFFYIKPNETTPK